MAKCPMGTLSWFLSLVAVTIEANILWDDVSYMIVGGKPGNQSSEYFSSHEKPIGQINDELPATITNGLGFSYAKNGVKKVMMVGGYDMVHGKVSDLTFRWNFERNFWETSHESGLGTSRDLAAITELPGLRYPVWITGGRNNDASYSSEFFDADSESFVPGPELPVALYGHCMLTLSPDETDSRTVLIIGGYHGRVDESYGVSSEVWAFSFKSDSESDPKVVQINNLNQPRMKHSCGVLKVGNSFKAVVAGGFNGESLSSVEVLDYQRVEHKLYSLWSTNVASKMPFPLHAGRFVSSPGCTSLTLLGGYFSYPRAGVVSNTALSLDADLNWTVKNGSMLRRADFAAILFNRNC